MGEGVAVKKASPRKPAKKPGAPAFRGARRPFSSPIPRVGQNPLWELKQVGMITLSLSRWSEAESKRHFLKAKALPPPTELRPRSRRSWACNEPYRAKPLIKNGYACWCYSDLFLTRVSCMHSEHTINPTLLNVLCFLNEPIAYAVNSLTVLRQVIVTHGASIVARCCASLVFSARSHRRFPLPQVLPLD